jgi:hypothetical protein
MSRQGDGQGRQLPWPSEANSIRRDAASGIPMVSHAGDDRPAKLLRQPGHCGEYLRRRDLTRGLPGDDGAPVLSGQPSGYSLPPARLAAHVRALRRSGWQRWEFRRRFEWPAA